MRPSGTDAEPSVRIVILAYAGYGLIGFIDDYLIVVKKNNDGPDVRRSNSRMQSLLAVVFFLLYRTTASTEVVLPLLGWRFDLGWLYFLPRSSSCSPPKATRST